MSKQTSSPLFGKLDAKIEKRADGTVIVRCALALPPTASSMNERLHHWAKQTPNQIFLAQRGDDGKWQRLTYAEVLAKVQSLAAALITRRLGPERPVLILSGNSIEHALLALACMEIGVPYCPLSTAYSLVSQDFGKLKYTISLLTPGLVFAQQGKVFAQALKSAIPPGIEIIVADGSEADFGGTAFAEMLYTPHSAKVGAAYEALSALTIAKFLLTSGSTGDPKAVTNTQGMLTANQVMIRETLVFLKNQPPVLVDWLPWSHTFGGNHNFGIVLYNGGSLYIDDGKPMPSGIAATVRNLREIAPTLYFNVPRGFEALLPHLEADVALRKNFFSKLNLMFYAGAGLTQAVWDRLHKIAGKTKSEPIPMTTSLGSTETAPAALMGVRIAAGPGNVGVPMPGVELKLIPNGGKLEARLRGPNITPGYWRKTELTAAAFDDEGFYKLGDALKPANSQDFSQGFVFDGRIAEDFKLDTGTWVSVGTLRTALVSHLAPYVKDVAITGHDRRDIGALIFPDFEALRGFSKNTAATAAELIMDSDVLALMCGKLQAFAALSTGSSNRISRATLLAKPPSIDLGEITDKGSLNQRAVLANRGEFIEQIYAETALPHVIIVAKEK